jgi:hypothetical protein
LVSWLACWPDRCGQRKLGKRRGARAGTMNKCSPPTTDHRRTCDFFRGRRDVCTARWRHCSVVEVAHRLRDLLPR